MVCGPDSLLVVCSDSSLLEVESLGNDWRDVGYGLCEVRQSVLVFEQDVHSAVVVAQGDRRAVLHLNKQNAPAKGG